MFKVPRLWSVIMVTPENKSRKHRTLGLCLEGGLCMAQGVPGPSEQLVQGDAEGREAGVREMGSHDLGVF